MTPMRRALLTLAVGLIGALISLFGVALAEVSSWDSGDVRRLVWWSITGCSGLLVISYFELFKLDIRDEVRLLEARRRDLAELERLRSALPTLVRFEKRTDILTVDARGNGVMTWSFRLRAPAEANLRVITLPIVTEIPPPDPTCEGGGPSDGPAVVRVRSLWMNGRALPPHGSYTVVDWSASPLRPSAPDPRVEEGLLRIPVDLGVGSTTCELRAVLEFRSVFRGEPAFFVVMIPYLTEELEVIVRSVTGHLVRAGSRATSGDESAPIRAYSTMLNLEDQRESFLQSDRLNGSASEIVWRTRDAKVGYRYLVNFRLESVAASGTESA